MALGQLQMQMTQATFDTWVKDTHAISGDDNNLVIGAKSAFAKDWLENRLFPTINRTVTGILDRPVDIRFEVVVPANLNGQDRPPTDTPIGGEQPVEAEPQEEEEPGIAFARATDFYAPKIEMGRWLAELEYDSHFWQPYLGLDEYLCHRKLLSLWIGSVQKKAEVRRLLDPSKAANQAWTPSFKISYRQLTRKMGKTNAKYIPGGVYECHRSDQARRILNQPCQECCGAHQLHEWRPLEDGAGGRCFYWRPGLIHRLFEEHLLTIEISSTNRATVQVWRTLPLLTPYQVGQLDELLQEEHEQFIERFGYLFNELTLKEWSSFTIRSMVPYQPGHPDGRECHGQPPQNPFSQSP